MKEKLIKSRQRVREFAEVYTPAHIVAAMCDLIPDEMWVPEKTFLEPTCGNGAFLAEILRRKLKRCKTEAEAKVAIGSIYGIDIQADNVQESRDRMAKIIAEFFPDLDASGILERNIIQADSLHENLEEMWK